MKIKENITTLNNDYMKKLRVEEKEKYRELIFRHRRLGMFAFISVIIFAFIAIQLKINYDKVVKVSAVKGNIIKQQKSLKKQKEKLKKEIKLLKDEDYVAKVARSKYYFSKKWEKNYTVPESWQDMKGN
ncbi:MAG: septum formation initiator family protein [Lactobacillales bacterium]|jgi:cell division protein DivIC|nr:septum formation initiator family protein [Lactobacillales bacterium]